MRCRVSPGLYALCCCAVLACAEPAARAPTARPVSAPTVDHDRTAQANGPEPPRDFHPDPSEWTSARDSQIGAFTRPAQGCLRDQGCLFQQIAIPPCPSNSPTSAAMSIGQALEYLVAVPEAWGRPFLVHGWLRQLRAKILMICDRSLSCCNGSSHYELHDNPEPISRSLGVVATGPKQAFACYGDRTLTCCDFEYDVHVLAFGKLAWRGSVDRALAQKFEWRGDITKYLLIDPLLCRPDNEPKRPEPPPAGSAMHEPKQGEPPPASSAMRQLR